MENKPKPMYRRFDSQAEVYRRATTRGMRAVLATLPPPQEPEPMPIPTQER